jgi:hypothetical protein
MEKKNENEVFKTAGVGRFGNCRHKILSKVNLKGRYGDQRFLNVDDKARLK